MADRRSGARALAVAVLAGLAAGALALWSVNRTWARVEVVSEGMPRTVVEIAGSAAVPWVGALALVMVTGSLALLPSGGRLRQVVGALVALAAVGVAIGALLAGDALADALRADLAASPAAAGADAEALAGAAERPPWRWLSLAAGLFGAGVGAWACLRAAAWPVMGSRYEAPAPGGAPTSPGRGAPVPAETDLWRAMDRGDDPT